MDVDGQEISIADDGGSSVSVRRGMTPEETREVLLDEARWWADSADYSESAAAWVTFFEQLPEDDPLLVLLAREYLDANAFRDRAGVHQFTVWNMTCNILQKWSQRWAASPT
jgi:hypothetical protein